MAFRTRLLIVLSAALAAAVASRPAHGAATPVDTSRAAPVHEFAGLYRVDADTSALIRVTCNATGQCRLVRPGQWSGSGRYSGRSYSGRWREVNALRGGAGGSGTHVAERQPDGSWLVTVRPANPGSRTRTERWRRVGSLAPGEGLPPLQPRPDTLRARSGSSRR